MNSLRTTPLAGMLAAALVATAVTAQRPTETSPTDGTPAAWTVHERSEVAASDIARGELIMRDPEVLERAIERGGAYVEFEFHVGEVLKGEPRRRLRLMFFAAPPGHAHRYRPDADDIRRFVGRRCILLLQQVGNRYFLADRFHGAAVLDDTPVTRDRILTLISRHAELAEMVPGPEVPLAGTVERILDEIAAHSDEERLGFSRLQEFGPEAVPAIVRLLEDARPIRSREIALTRRQIDSRGPFVTLRPEQFGDVLFSVLQEMTGRHFGFDNRGGRPHQRQVAIQGWRIYAQYVLAEQANTRHASFRSIKQSKRQG